MFACGTLDPLIEAAQGDLVVRLIERVHHYLHKELVDLVEEGLDRVLIPPIVQEEEARIYCG